MASSKPKSRRADRRPPATPVISATPSWWDRLPPWGRDLTGLGLLLLVSLLFFAPTTFGGRQLFSTDTLQSASAMESVRAYEEETGDKALWAPNMFSGMPVYLISYQPAIPQLDTLMRVVRQAVWPALHFFVMLAGMYWLVFFLTRVRWAALAGAFAYGLTTYIPIILAAGHNTKFITLAYAPYLVLAFAFVIRRALPEDESGRPFTWQVGLIGALLFAIALAINIRAAHIQITYYVAWLLALWWLVEGVHAFRRGQGARFGAATGWLALGSVVALLMVANPYLAIWEYKAYTIRGGGDGAGGLAWDYGMQWSQGIGEMVTLLIPHAYGGGELYWGPKPFTAGPHYVGPIVLALAVLALWRVRRPAVWAMGLSAGVMTLFAFGRHFPLLNRPFFDYFPLFDSFRAPETWLVMVAFALAVLAGFGLAHLLMTSEARTTKAGFVAFGAVAVLTLLLLFGRDMFFDFEKEGEVQQVAQLVAQQNNVSPDDPRVLQTARQYVAQQKEPRMAAFSGDAWRTMLFLLLAGVAVFLTRRGTVPRWAGGLLLVLLVLVDVYGVGKRYLNEEHTRDVRHVRQAVDEYGFDRFIRQKVEEAGGSGHFRTLSLEQNPASWARPAFYYETIGGYHGAKLQVYQDFLEYLLLDARGTNLNLRGLNLLSTRYIITSRPIPGMNIVHNDQVTSMLVLENPEALPRAFLVGEAEVVADATAALERVQQSDFDPRRSVVLTQAPEVAPIPADSSSTARVQLQAFTPDEITWQVETDAPRVLVASEIYYPAGWKAYVDGEPAPIYRANYLLRAVPVPEGSHTVTMRFEPASHTTGVWISGITTLLAYLALGALLLLGWRQQAKPEEVNA